MPIGHRYTGTFYLKQAYSVPAQSVKITGSAYMKEDLVSWSLDADDPKMNDYSYHREIFKDKNLKTLIKRDDADPVFEKNLLTDGD